MFSNDPTVKTANEALAALGVPYRLGRDRQTTGASFVERLVVFNPATGNVVNVVATADVNNRVQRDQFHYAMLAIARTLITVAPQQ